MTWLRAEPDCHWFDDEPDPLTTALRLIASTLKGERQSTGSPFDGRLNDT
jgi:tRNA dimethylallyltransferase